MLSASGSTRVIKDVHTAENISMSQVQFQSVQGPTDSRLRHSAIEGYQPVSRIGEVVQNAFVDVYEFGQLEESITIDKMNPSAFGKNTNTTTAEHRPLFHEWASVLPGMICIARKARNATFRNYVAAETAVPVISCCACMGIQDENNFYFAGICRSKSVRPIDDGSGPAFDEFFTLAIGGMATILNTSTDYIYAGDMIEWTFYSEHPNKTNRRVGLGVTNPRRVGVQISSGSSARIIGMAKSSAAPGTTFDILIKAC